MWGLCVCVWGFCFNSRFHLVLFFRFVLFLFFFCFCFFRFVLEMKDVSYSDASKQMRRRRVRQTFINNEKRDCIEKISLDKVDALVTTTIPTKDLGAESSLYPHQGLSVRVATSREQKIDVPSCYESTLTEESTRNKARVSFISKKGDFQIDCTRVESLKSNESKREKAHISFEVWVFLCLVFRFFLLLLLLLLLLCMFTFVRFVCGCGPTMFKCRLRPRRCEHLKVLL